MLKYLLLTILSISAIYGAVLESDHEMKLSSLQLGLHLSGLGGMMAVTCLSLKKMDPTWKIWVLLILQFIAYRIAFFPIMVLSATVACYSEWLLIKFVPDLPIKIFPAFLISTASMFVVISLLLYFSIKGNINAILLITATMIPMAMISFSKQEDLAIFPDKKWTGFHPLPEIKLPIQNPYRYARRTQEMNLNQRLIALAGALLYPIIPEAPWALAAKGTLEQAYRDNPAGSSSDRLLDHYVAFLGAHRLINRATKNSINSFHHSSGAGHYSDP